MEEEPQMEVFPFHMNYVQYLEDIYKVRFCRLSGSFEPIFDLILGSNILLSILPLKLNRKAAKIIQKIDEYYFVDIL